MHTAVLFSKFYINTECTKKDQANDDDDKNKNNSNNNKIL